MPKHRRCTSPTATDQIISDSANHGSGPCRSAKRTSTTAIDQIMLKEGEKAPAWSGKDQHGIVRSSAEFEGSWLLLYFYPKDDTPGCTIEACGFRDDESAFADRITVVGVSKDSVESHKKFAEKFALQFALIADTEKTMIDAYGTDGVILPKRVTFLIDPEQTIRKMYHGFDCTNHSADVRKDMDAFGI